MKVQSERLPMSSHNPTSEQQYSTKDYKLSVYVLPLANVGAGLTWSGLPFLLSEETQNIGNMFVLFMASTLAGAFFTLLGGTFADAFKRKPIVVATLVLDVVLTSCLGYFGNKDSVLLFYTVGFVNSLAGAVSGLVLKVWIKDIISSKTTDLARSLARRGLLTIGAKATGFALGPLVYSWAKFHALYIDAAFSLITLLMLFYLSDFSRPRTSARSIDGGYLELLRADFWSRERLLVLSLFSLTAAYTVPTVMVSYAVLLHRYSGGGIDASTFWILASMGSLVSHFGMTQKIASRLGSGQRLLVSQLVMGISFLSLWFAPNAIWFVASFVLFTLANPVMSNSLETEVYEKCEDAFRGRFNALCAFGDDVIGFLVLLYCQQTIDQGGADSFYIIMLPLMLLVLFLVWTNRTFLQASTLNNPEIGVGH
jgi:Major Facilitator Superfamily